MSGLAILRAQAHFTALAASVRRRSTHQASHSTPVIHGRSSTPASPSPAPTLRPPARKERAPNALVADRDSHCSLTAQERTASTATRAKRGRLGPPTPYSSSCSGSQRRCFQPLTSNFRPAPLLPPTKTPTRPHPRAHIHLSSTIASSPPTADLSSAPKARAHQPVSSARASSRRPVARAQAPQRKHLPCANRKRLLLSRPRRRVEPSATGA